MTGVRATALAGAALLAVIVLPGNGPIADGAPRCRAQKPHVDELPAWARSRRATVLVDSVLLSGYSSLRSRRPCWRLIKYGRPALMVGVAERELRGNRGRIAPLVIVGLGYNSLWERRRRRHAHWAARFDAESQRLLRTLRRLGARQIVWVTLREPSADTVPPAARGQLGQYSWYFPYVNGRLRYLDRRHDDVVLTNWKVASDRSGLTYDSIHLNTVGAELMARTIWRTVSEEARRQAR
jgi:hypothetical protein